MKKLATLLIACFAIQFAQAQYVLVNSPSAVAGSKAFSIGSMSVDLLSGVWTADCVVADPIQGCTDLTNAAAIAGKIVLIDRGTCNFSTKIMNAKKAGAFAAVVFNNAVGGVTIVMGSTAIVGDTLPLIPCVMLSLEDGVALKAAAAAGTVNMTIGNYKFNNDIHVDRKLVLNGPVGTIPVSQLPGFSFTPGAGVRNNGLLDAHNVNVNGVIKFTPAAGGATTTVSNQTASLPFLAVDSTELVELPAFTPGTVPGKYDFTYTLNSDSIDNVDADNTATSEFTVSTNVYGKGRWDAANNRPFQTNAYRPSAVGAFEFIAGFNFPKGGGYSIDSMSFYVTTQAIDLMTKLPAGQFTANLYEWVDADFNGFLNAGELIVVSIEEVPFTVPGLKSAWVNAPVNDLSASSGSGIKIKDGSAYFLGVRCEVDSTFIGFDETYDYTASVELSPNVVNEVAVGYLGTTIWDGVPPSVDDLFTFTNTRVALAAAVYVNPVIIGTNDLTNNVSIRLLPNPVSDELVAEVNLLESTESLEYKIFDGAGRMVSRSVSDINGSSDKALFNVSKLAAGQYFLMVKSAKGSKSTPFTVQH